MGFDDVPGWVFAVLAAPFVGSFLGVLSVRLPEGRRAWLGRSRCPRCGQALGPVDLVPIVSWVVMRGRCRHCTESIGIFYPAVELAALVIAVWAATELSGWLLWVSCGLGWALLALAAMDLRRMVLVDTLTVPLIAAGFLVSYAIDPAIVPDHLAGAAIGFVLFAAIAWAYHRLRGREGLGLGDAKLLAAAGAWLSWTALPSVVGVAAIAAIVVQLAGSRAGRTLSLTRRVAFGPYLCGAIWLVWLYGPVITT